MPSVKCVSFEEIEDGQCTILERGKKFLMGGDLVKYKEKPSGIFYLETLEEAPYTIPDVTVFDKIKMIDYTPVQS